MKPSDKIRADGIEISDETAALLDRGWEDYVPGVTDVDVIEIEDDYMDPKGWDLILFDTGAVVRSVGELEQWLREQAPGGSTLEEFKRLDIYHMWVDQPGFEWLRSI